MRPDDLREFMVFDCESVGLYGETFAVGWVMLRRDGVRHHSGAMHCASRLAEGDVNSRQWLADHIPRNLQGEEVGSPRMVRHAFWQIWEPARRRDVRLFADCLWPVEARFLRDCVADDPARDWHGPYPFHEIATLRLAAGLNPIGVEPRLPDEKPVHDPLCDALQSARLLIEALDMLERR